MSEIITFRADKTTRDLLNAVANYTGRKKSDLIKESLRVQLKLIQLQAIREMAQPKLHAAGYFTEDDIMNDPDIMT